MSSDCPDVESADELGSVGGRTDAFIDSLNAVGVRADAFIDSLSVSTKLGDTVSLYIILCVDQGNALAASLA